MVIDKRKTYPSWLSIPLPLYERIEKDRGQISRSRFLLNMIEFCYRNNGGFDKMMLKQQEEIAATTKEE